MTTVNHLKRDIAILQKALDAREPKVKPAHYVLDVEGDKSTLTETEKDIAREGIRIFERKYEEAKKAQNCRGPDIDWSKVFVTEEENCILAARKILFQRHAISIRERSRRYPIH